jgi:hypothetical protein
LIKDGPEKCGFTGDCWRSPMIQELILNRCGLTPVFNKTFS